MKFLGREGGSGLLLVGILLGGVELLVSSLLPFPRNNVVVGLVLMGKLVRDEKCRINLESIDSNLTLHF